MAHLRVCVYISTEHPETLEYNISTTSKPSAGNDDNNTTEEARTNVTKQNDGLDHFQLILKAIQGKSKLSGEDLFNHVVAYRNVNNVEIGVDGDPKKSLPLASLEVELSRDGVKCIQPSKSELRHASILRESIGD